MKTSMMISRLLVLCYVILKSVDSTNTPFPTIEPLMLPQNYPSSYPTAIPFNQPTKQPRKSPSLQPLSKPTEQPTNQPDKKPIFHPSGQPKSGPSRQPLWFPTCQPSKQPRRAPSQEPSLQPTQQPRIRPKTSPTTQPTRQPVARPNRRPSRQPTCHPSGLFLPFACLIVPNLNINYQLSPVDYQVYNHTQYLRSILLCLLRIPHDCPHLNHFICQRLSPVSNLNADHQANLISIRLVIQHHSQYLTQHRNHRSNHPEFPPDSRLNFRLCNLPSNHYGSLQVSH